MKRRNFLAHLLSILSPRAKKKLDEIRWVIWIHKGCYLTEKEAIEMAVNELYQREVLLRGYDKEE